MSTIFLTKSEVAKMITNQFQASEKIKERMAIKIAKFHEVDFMIEVKNAGFVVENFGYNRYYIN